MKVGRFIVSVVAAGALMPLTAAAAVVAPPGNDKPDGAVSLALGDTYKEDTSQATTDQIDARANQVCGAPFTNASVWFTYTPKSNGTSLLDLTASDYSGGLMVFQGDKPSPAKLLACGPGQIAMAGKGGTTYLIMAFSDTKVNGGNLVLKLDDGPPPPTIKATLDATGTVLPKGKAEVSGTITCTNTTLLEIDGQLRQIWHRIKINGYFTIFHVNGDLCDGKSHPWSRIVTSHNGTYAAGDATFRIRVSACGLLDCSNLLVRRHVTLAKGDASASGDNVSSSVVLPMLPSNSRHWPSAS